MGELANIILRGMDLRASAIREAGRVRRQQREKRPAAIRGLGESFKNIGNQMLKRREEDEIRALDETFTQGMIEFGEDDDGLMKAVEAAMANRPRTNGGTQKMASIAIQAEALTAKRRAAKLKAEAERLRQQRLDAEEARRKLEAETASTKAGTADRKQTAAEKAAEDKLKAQAAEAEDTAAVFAPTPDMRVPVAPSFVPGMQTPQMNLPGGPPSPAQMLTRLGERKNVPNSVRNAVLSQYGQSIKPVKPTTTTAWKPGTMSEAEQWARMQAGIKAEFAPKPKPPAASKRSLPETLKLRKDAVLKQFDTAFTEDAQKAAQTAMETLQRDIEKWENGGTAPASSAPAAAPVNLGLTPEEQAEYDAMSPGDQEAFRKAIGR